MYDFDIDLVVPYVDSSDPEWQKVHYKYMKSKNNDEQSGDSINRYRSWDNLNLWIKLAEKYAQFVRKIFVVVMQESQIPAGIADDPKVQIILHSDFIPKKFLPTFNSTSIEMFLQFIPDLSEHFIYSNDDIFFTSVCKASDFFDQNGNPKFKTFNRDSYGKNMFGDQMRNSFNKAKTVAASLTGKDFNKNKFVSLEHTMFPMLKSIQEESWENDKNLICSTVTSVRDVKNCNQHLWNYTSLLVGKHSAGGPSFSYYAAKDRDITRICRAIQLKQKQIICVNDFGTRDFNNVKRKINATLESNLNDILPKNAKVLLPKVPHEAVHVIKSSKIPYVRISGRPNTLRYKQKTTKTLVKIKRK